MIKQEAKGNLVIRKFIVLWQELEHRPDDQAQKNGITLDKVHQLCSPFGRRKDHVPRVSGQYKKSHGKQSIP